MPTSAPVDVSQAATWFHALSDTTRLEIIELLRAGERCVCELTDEMDAAQSRLSFHLKTLKEAGLVLDRREGRWVYYTLNRECLDEIESVLRTFRPTSPVRTLTDGSCCG